MFERFTTSARETVQSAHAEAAHAHARFVGTEHLLIGLLEVDRGAAFTVLTSAGVTADRARSEAARIVGRPAKSLGPDDAEALKAIGIDLDAVVASVEQTFGPGALDSVDDEEPPRGKRGLFGRRGSASAADERRSASVLLGGGGRHVRFSPRTKKVLELSLREALHRKDNYIGAEHILLGLIREGDGVAAKILTDAGLSLADLRTRLGRELGDAA